MLSVQRRGGEEEGEGGNGREFNIRYEGAHSHICGNEYTDNWLAELSEQICTHVTAETHGKCATRSRDSATTARFIRITLFDVQKFRASAPG